MCEDIHGLTNPSNKSLVEGIRVKLLSEAETNADLYHEIDVERVRTEDWQIERYVLYSKDKAYDSLVKTMRWKKSYGVHDRSLSYFPRELVYIFEYEKFSADREGRPVRWTVGRHFRKISDFRELVFQFLVYQLESHDRAGGNRGFVAVGGMKGTGYSNTDMSSVSFMLEVVPHYPEIPGLNITTDLPWIFNGFVKITMNLLPKHIRDKTRIIASEELTDYIDVEEIPIGFGGKRDTVYPNVDRMSPLYECKHLGFTDKQIDNFYRVYKDLFNRDNNNY